MVHTLGNHVFVQALKAIHSPRFTALGSIRVSLGRAGIYQDIMLLKCNPYTKLQKSHMDIQLEISHHFKYNIYMDRPPHTHPKEKTGVLFLIILFEKNPQSYLYFYQLYVFLTSYTTTNSLWAFSPIHRSI